MQDPTLLSIFTSSRIKDEIKAQVADKSCGSDGIHIRLLKSLADTEATSLLEHLFLLCIRLGCTPKSWNQTDIHLLSKDPRKRRDANNLRPITIICIFRKLFERLLLHAFDWDGWAKLHPAQAGFRAGYSVNTNAATLHVALSTRARSTAVFLDFRSAFDMVDHKLLHKLLLRRGCPPLLRNLLSSLMFDAVRSRLLLNDDISPPFQRSRGLLQGSPLSPPLFNIFIDDLLHELNRQSDPLLPNCLFYADDGVILARSPKHAQRLLEIAQAWAGKAGLTFNVSKCAVVTDDSDAALLLQGEIVPLRKSFSYLGFPVTLRGVDFAKHLSARLTAAVQLSDFLSLSSDAWGIANRLRVYGRYIAPIFEFGAPLVDCWRRQHPKAFTRAIEPWKKLMTWINGGSKSRANATSNLLGLIPLSNRFQHLRTQYQLVLQSLSPDNPLRLLLTSRTYVSNFLSALRRDAAFDDFIGQVSKPSLQTYLRKQRQATITHEVSKNKLTQIIPLECRRVLGLHLADVALSAPTAHQRLLFTYRLSQFRVRKTCACGKPYLRTHETCSFLPHPVQLSKQDRQEKAVMISNLSTEDCKVTDVDYLLNKGRLDEAIRILLAIQERLGQAWSLRMLAEADSP